MRADTVSRSTQFVVIAVLWLVTMFALANTAMPQTVRADRFQLNTGPCVIRSGSGAPDGALGAVCDEYHRTDSPYTIYKKTGASTWTALIQMPAGATTDDLITAASASALGRIADVGAGSVLVSNSGTPGWSVAPSVTSLNASNYVTAAGYLAVDGINPILSMHDTDGASNEKFWDVQAASGFLQFRTLDDAYGNPVTWMTADRAGTTLSKVSMDPTLFGSTNYVSQTTGWGIDNLGAADFRYLFSDEMHVRVFIADLEQALAGLQVITKSVAVLQADFTCPALGATATLSVEDLPGAADMQVFDTSDWVSVRAFSRAAQTLSIGDCVGQVSSPNTSFSGYQTWTFTRGTGGSGGAWSTGVVSRGGVVLDYGVSGNGYYEVNAVDGTDAINSPYSQTVRWTTAPVAANRVVTSRLGNLRGITAVDGETGLIAGVYDTDADARYIRASNQAVELHGVDFRMYDSGVSSGGTPVFRIERGSGTAPYLALGAPAPTTFGSGTGCWMGDDGGTYKFRCGIPGGDRFEFDGTNVTISGRLTVGTGRNFLSNTEFRQESAGPFGSSTGTTYGTDGPKTGIPGNRPSGVGGSNSFWTLGFYNGTGSPTWSWRCNDLTYPSGGCRVSEDVGGGVPSASSVKQVYGPSMPAAAGQYYEFSFYSVAGAPITSMCPYIAFYNSSGTFISAVGGNTCVTTNPGGGASIANWARAWAYGVAPANTSHAMPYFEATYNGTDANTSFYVLRTLFSEAGAGQTTPTAWSPGGITTVDGEHLATNLVISNTIRSDGATALTTGTGYWLDATGTPTFRVGNPSGNQIKWDGTNLTTTSAGVTIDSTGITIATTSSAIWDAPSAYRFSYPSSDATGGLSGTRSGTNRYLQLEQAVNSGLDARINLRSTSAAGNAGLDLVSEQVSFTRTLATLYAGTVAIQGDTTISTISSDGTGKVVCIKSDTTLGTCNASSITTSGCTCS